MELTKAPEPISERQLRVRFLGSGQPENSLWEESRGSVTHFLLVGGEQRLFPLVLKASRVLIE